MYADVITFGVNEVLVTNSLHLFKGSHNENSIQIRNGCIIQIHPDSLIIRYKFIANVHNE